MSKVFLHLFLYVVLIATAPSLNSVSRDNKKLSGVIAGTSTGDVTTTNPPAANL